MESKMAFYIVLAIMFYILVGTWMIHHVKDIFFAIKRECFKRKYKMTVIGEIVGIKHDKRRSVLDFVLDLFPSTWQETYYQVYSAKVSYTVNFCTYEVEANEYTIEKPIIGQKVYVHYNPHKPTKMCLGRVVDKEPEVVKVGRQPLWPIALLKARGYDCDVVGEVVRIKKKYIGCKGMAPWLGTFVTKQEVYSSIVRYKVFGTIYEIDAGDYSDAVPVIGDKVLVLYHSRQPEKACVPTWRNSKKNIEVFKCDEEFVYCLYNNNKRIKIPIRWVEDGVQPGSYLVHWYGFYQLE